MASIPTISELLTLSGSQFRIYDLGRKISKLSKEQFSKIEANQLPYPFPSQGHAYIGVVFWQKKTAQTYMWFIKLPLDERGLLNLGARNHFIAIIVEALGSDLTINPTSQQEELLKNNPYHFTPAQYKLASLNSMVNYDVNKKSSQYYAETQSYLFSEKGWDNWANIGVQGLADFAVRINDEDNAQALSSALPHLPLQVLEPLCSALENHSLPLILLEAIISRLENETIEHPSFTSLIRALSSSCRHPLVKGYLEAFISKQSSTPQASSQKSISIDAIIILAGRCWEVFAEEKIVMSFLERIVEHKDDELFISIFKDLVAIPTIRPILLTCMRSTERSPELSKAIGLLFNTSKT